ncbi:alpha/beta hydrolase [Nonomuraea typhae]|uniref:Alpha/beta hydrolase n=1 Tax=Nonomuraea typhae TaxID=2603600 RepID=A0ABW7YPG2_9ACTN
MRFSTRLRRRLLTALVAASVAAPVSGAAGSSAVPAPVPGALPYLSVTTLDARYAAARAEIRGAERAAAAAGHGGRAAALRAMAAPGRRFLSFDGRDGGRSAEVFGDLARADRIAVLVPGSGTTLDTYGRLYGGAAGLAAALGERGAVIAWLGYATPSGTSLAVATTMRAEEAAPGLRAFTRALAAARPDARLSLACHSYGAVVCGSAAPGLPVHDIVLFGSPGAGAATAAGLRTTATVWAGRGSRDWIAGVPHASFALGFATVGLGADPVSPAFGARIFPAGTATHNDYLTPGFPSLRAIAQIVTGHDR